MKRYCLMICAFLILVLISNSVMLAQHKSNKAVPVKPAAVKTSVVAMKTSLGTIVLEMYDKEAPKTVQNFVGLAKKGYYNGIIFHRVIDGFMIQGGDPTGTGRGGQSLWGNEFNDEVTPKLAFDKAGVMAMANKGPNTNGSQFFITLGPQPQLNMHYSIFGQVTKGMEVVRAIGKTPKNGERPITPVKIESIKVETK